jgi:signal transduction histidine kinase
MKEKMIEKRVRRGILPKMLVSFLLLSIIPLIIMGYAANKNLTDIGGEAVRRGEEMGAKSLNSARKIGGDAINDSVSALDQKSTEAIELRTCELAQRVADFLYERDKDLLLLATFPPEAQRYLQVYQACRRDVTLHGPWPPDPEEKQKEVKLPEVKWRNPENRESWRHRPPDNFRKVSRPLYKEITFIGLDGQEKIKIAGGKISGSLADVSKKENTYCRAEDYFSQLRHLRKGEIYVSRVIGPYVKGWLEKTPEGMKVRPESAYAGKENPGGRRFEGIIRWATPVYGAGGEKTGYLTLALDHTHVMEFTEHVVPTEERFSDISDAGSGNYAFMWDFQDKCISHPRDFFICGFDPETGEEVPGWISEETYREYEKSGLTLNEFVKRLPPFRNFSQKKQGSGAQMKAGCISLDGRILDTAPQCEDWHTGTGDGGSGSFLIFWSGLWKLTTHAAIPYYTGMYGQSRRGFGYVTIGANVDEFHKAANKTKAEIQESILTQEKDMEAVIRENRKLINDSLAHNRRLTGFIALISALAVVAAAVVISWNITGPIKRLTAGAVAMSRGDLQQAIEVKSRDEIGQLAASFNEMAAAVAAVDRMKSEFVTTASHELRTPIQAMLLSVSGLLAGYSGQIDDEAKEDLQLAKSGIERLTRLVDDLLDLSRIEARKLELSVTLCDVAEIVQQAREEVADLARAHGHEIILDIPPDLPHPQVDRDRIIQVVINLLSNAIKYTPDGGRILISAASRDDELLLRVADNGYGIPIWARKEVFKKFFQADSIMSQRVGGSGLGLTISQGIVEEHGGYIECDSPLLSEGFPELNLGGERLGTVFTVHLPRKITGPKGRLPS